MINIKAYKEQVKSLEPLKNGIIYRPQKWVKHFKKGNILDCAIPYIGKEINRKTVIQEYKKYFNGKTSDYKIPFLFTMIWGYDSNYGPHRTGKIMANKQNLEFVKAAFDAMNKKNVTEAFNHLIKVKGLGISYISKILYFAGKAKHLKNYPLIFDIRVASSLVSIASNGILDEWLKISPSDKLESYNSYNELIHKWSTELQVDADQIEFFLFEKKF